jgi:hypothetical protein
MMIREVLFCELNRHDLWRAMGLMGLTLALVGCSA